MVKLMKELFKDIENHLITVDDINEESINNPSFEFILSVCHCDGSKIIFSDAGTERQAKISRR